MKVEEIVKKLEEEIKGENRKDLINEYETKLCKEIIELSKNSNFFKLPLKNIFSVISKVDFSEIEENDKVIETLKILLKI